MPDFKVWLYKVEQCLFLVLPSIQIKQKILLPTGPFELGFYENIPTGHNIVLGFFWQPKIYSTRSGSEATCCGIATSL